MSLTVQALDGLYGRSAGGVRVQLSWTEGSGWLTLAETAADSEGFIRDWGLPHLDRGQYRIAFDTDRYFAELGGSGAYPEVTVTFRVDDLSIAHHVQVTLAPHSHATCFWTC